MEEVEDEQLLSLWDAIDYQEEVIEDNIAVPGNLFPDISCLEPVASGSDAVPGGEHEMQGTSAAAASDYEEGEGSDSEAGDRSCPRGSSESQLLKKHALLAPCSCKKGCGDSFNEASRENIRKRFWRSPFHGRRGFFSSHITIKPVKRRRTKTDETCEESEEVTEKKVKKSRTLNYSLPRDDGTVTEVCKTMFLHTLGMKTDGMVTTFIQQKTSTATTADESVCLLTDGRGRAPALSRICKEPIRAHIKSYHPQVSHYKQEHAPHRRYLESHLTITDMWRDYNESHQKISYQTYRKVFECEKITFGQPPQDDCDTCKCLTNHLKQVGLSLDALGSKTGQSASGTTHDSSDPATGPPPRPTAGEPSVPVLGQQVSSNILTFAMRCFLQQHPYRTMTDGTFFPCPGDASGGRDPRRS